MCLSVQLIAEGSVDPALKGKHYNRAQCLYKLFYEALMRHLIQTGMINGHKRPDSLLYFLDVIRDTEIDFVDHTLCLEMLADDQYFDDFISALFGSVTGTKSHLANYIIELMEMFEVLFMNIDSI